MRHPEKLARMANQIATFFRSYPEEEAVAGIHDHVKAYWSPRMLQDLDALIDAEPARIDPFVIAAFRRFARAESPTHREAEGPGTMGELASDAG